MKNLKKTLCLVLALAMIFGCMALDAGAVFDDQSEIQNPEAVAVLNELGVLVGYEGEFKPADTLTRAEGTTIIARLLLGVSAADELTVSTAPFADVAADNWAAGYIAYCSSEGIVDGIEGGKFDPNGTLTVAQFAKMLLGALGYDSDTEGFTGASWQINTITTGAKVGLFDGISGAYTDSCIRDDAAQMALNTLKGTMVYYPSGKVTVNSGDTTVVVGGSAATKEAAIESTDGNIYDDDYLQFAENYFPKLVLDGNADTSFGRPAAYSWKLNNTVIYTGADESDLLASYTAPVTRGTLYTLVGSAAYKALSAGSADLAVYVNGEEAEEADITDYIKKSSSSSVTGSGRGVLTEVYMDDDYNVTIVEIDTYLAVAADDYDEDSESLDIDIYSNSTNYGNDKDSATLYVEDGFDIDDYVEDDWLLVTIDDGTVYSAIPAETVSGTISAYSKGSSVTVGGNKYNYSAAIDAEFDTTAYKISSDIVLILDAYGYVIGLDDVDASSSYVYISEIAKSGTLSSAAYIAAAFFPDGTYEEITLKSVDGETAEESTTGGWFTYTVNTSGKYVLTSVDDDNIVTSSGEKVTTKNGSLYMTDKAGKNLTSAKLTTSTKIIVLDDDGDLNAYTGYADIPTINSSTSKEVSVTAVTNGNGYATYVFIDAGDATVRGGTTTSSDYLFVYSEASGTSVDSNDIEYSTYYYALLNGEDEAPNTTTTLSTGLYTDLVYDEYGYLEDAEAVEKTTDYVDVIEISSEDDIVITYSSGVLTIGEESYALADDYSIFVFGEDAEGSPSYKTYTAAKLAKLTLESSVENIYVVKDDNDAVTAIYIF